MMEEIKVPWKDSTSGDINTNLVAGISAICCTLGPLQSFSPYDYFQKRIKDVHCALLNFVIISIPPPSIQNVMKCGSQKVSATFATTLRVRKDIEIHIAHIEGFVSFPVISEK